MDYRLLHVLMIVTIIVLSTSSSPAVHAKSVLEDLKFVYTVELQIGGNITNLGKEPIQINETDLLIYNYPFNTSSQEVLYASLYYNGVQIPFKIERNEEGYSLIPNITVNDVLGFNETASSMVLFRVRINVTKRIEEIRNLSFSNAGTWDEIPDTLKDLSNVTSLWNYTNPLIKLLYKYILRNASRTPLHYLASTLNWINSYVKYNTRVPPRHPWEVILRRKGDCDDQSNLIITLLRAAGIPSYLETGMVYVSKSFYSKTTTADGFFTYEFIGGGAHGWLTAYIPPWGFVRVDLTFASGVPGNLQSMLRHIKKAAYYSTSFPTILMSEIKKEDYVEQGIKFIEEIKEEKIRYEIFIKIKIVSKEVYS